MLPVNILIEGRSDESVAKQLVQRAGLKVGAVYGNKGKAYLLERLPNYNRAAQFAPWFGIVDLDSEPCAAKAIALWLPQPTEGMCFRIAIHAIEAWLMADREKMAAFLAVSPSRLPSYPELEHDPKEMLINIARHSRSSIREDIVPRQGSGAKVGPLYVARLNEFTEKHWRPEIAEQCSESLHRCIKALSTLANRNTGTTD